MVHVHVLYKNRTMAVRTMASLTQFAGGKDHKFMKERSEAKERQKWFKKSQLIRQYKKDLKNEGLRVEKTDECDTNTKKRHVDEEAADRTIDESTKATSISSTSSKKSRVSKNDPFFKEKAIAEAARIARETEAQRIQKAESERAKKLKHRRNVSKSLAERDSRGRPRVKNTMSLILEKLKSESN